MVKKQPDTQDLYKTIFGLKVGVASLILFIIALPLFYFQATTPEPWSTFFGALGATLAPVALITLIYESWLRRTASLEVKAATTESLPTLAPMFKQAIEANNAQIVPRILDGLSVGQSMRDSGIAEIRHFPTIDWSAFFGQGGNIDICVGYAETWSRSNAWKVVESASKHGNRVRLTLLDPEGPQELVQFYAATWGAIDVDVLTQRIESVRAIWREQVQRIQEESGSVRVVIEGIKRHVPYTFYSCGESMWLVLAPRRAGRRPERLPALLCRKTGSPAGLFDWAMEDLEACRRDEDIRVMENLGD